jgi:hypothetical protein
MDQDRQDARPEADAETPQPDQPPQPDGPPHPEPPQPTAGKGHPEGGAS